MAAARRSVHEAEVSEQVAAGSEQGDRSLLAVRARVRRMREWIKSLSDRTEFFLVTTICFAYVVVSSVAILLLRVQRMEISTSRAWRGIAFEAGVLLLAVWILHVRGWRLGKVTSPITWKSLIAGIPLFIGFMLLYWSTALFAVAVFPDVAKTRPFQIIHTASPAAIAIFFLINSIYEEFAVTGYVITALEGHGAAFAITASTLIRFLYHVYQGPLASLSILPLGILFGVVYQRYRTLWPLVIAHTMVNFLSYAVHLRTT